MTGPVSSIRGSRVRGALSVLRTMEEAGRLVTAEGEGLKILPGEGLHPGDLTMVRALKPELVALVRFTPEQRAILSKDVSINLEDLHRYREGLECWLRFTPEEQARMMGHPWMPEDLEALYGLRQASGGEIVECGETLTPLRETAPRGVG